MKVHAMNLSGSDLVAIFLIAALCAPFIVALLLNSRQKLAQQETLRLAIQSGQPIDGAMLKILTKMPPSPDRDLRQGIISTSLAIGLGIAATFSATIMKQNDLAPLLGMAAIIVLAVGVGQLAAWKLRNKVSSTSQDQQE